MPLYAIGDIQGCDAELGALLEHHECLHRVAENLVGDADHRRLFDPGDVAQLYAGFSQDTARWGGNQTSSARNDLQYTVSAGLRYAFTSNLSAEVTYALNLGRNAQDGVTNPQYREFDENLVSLGAVFKF